MLISILYIFHAYVSALEFKWKQADEFDGNNNYIETDKKWHFWGAWNRVLFAISSLISIILYKLNLISLGDIAISCSIYLFSFDMLVNKLALNQKLFYPGSSTLWDIKLGNKKWIYYSIALILSIVIKILGFDDRIFDALIRIMS